MAGPTKSDVMYALLALDAYNRSADIQNRVIFEKSGDEISTQIGNATWKQSSDRIENAPGDTLAGSQASGFSASFYTLDGKKVVSYRGTDFPTSIDFEQLSSVWRDVRDGWLTSFGVTAAEASGPGGTGVNTQPYYALEFYDVATGANRQLSLEEKRALIAAGQKVGALEDKLAIARSEKADAETELPQAQEDLATAQQSYNAALADAGGNPALVPNMFQEGLSGAQAQVDVLDETIAANDNHVRRIAA
jgi:hypothetical protein